MQLRGLFVPKPALGTGMRACTRELELWNCQSETNRSRSSKVGQVATQPLETPASLGSQGQGRRAKKKGSTKLIAPLALTFRPTWIEF